MNYYTTVGLGAEGWGQGPEEGDGCARDRRTLSGRGGHQTTPLHGATQVILQQNFDPNNFTSLQNVETVFRIYIFKLLCMYLVWLSTAAAAIC